MSGLTIDQLFLEWGTGAVGEGALLGLCAIDPQEGFEKGVMGLGVAVLEISQNTWVLSSVLLGSVLDGFSQPME